MTLVSWIDEDDVLAWPNLPTPAEGLEGIEEYANIASYLLYEASGRQYPGEQDETRRPCRTRGSCWSGSSTGIQWYWQSAWVAGAMNWYWTDEAGHSLQCGCGALSEVWLPGYPTNSITAVKIDGSVLDPSEYRLDPDGRLVRMAAPDGTEQLWPSCQRLDLPDTQPGTFSVRYKWGAPPPQMGKDAAVELAIELWNAKNSGKCRLPQKVTKVVRQGVTLERVVPFAQMLAKGETGLVYVDLFVGAANPTGMQRRPAVFSPDTQPYARKLGS